MGPIGLPELLLIAAVALVVFGPARLPELGRSLGRAMREFRSAVRALDDDSPNGSGQGDGAGRSTA
ncbi:MAG TPA: twin-arginine translocase TatA/TatE family subunit, partial [Thermaerobacter sp.]